ncbi:MAG: glycosyltransferase family 39 protein [Ignavibacteriota bacterium]
MPLGEKKVRRLTGILLVIGVLVTRLPFISKMLFEFDSVDFAVATFRFDLGQVTPHFPGYILHILFAKFLLLFISDTNLAFVVISILLSIGSVLFLWRAGAALRGERVGVVAAVLWLFTPIFWFYGEVATAYMYEAFFASAFLYFGIRLLRCPSKKWIVYSLFIFLSLATGARQSSILFFTPCVIYFCWVTRQPLKTWIGGIILFSFVTAAWSSILFWYSGGIGAYFTLAGSQSVYRSQSIIFGNQFGSHLRVIAKIFLYLIVAALPFVLIFGLSILKYPGRTNEFIRSQFRKRSFRFVALVGLPAFLFYIVIYFIKAGYLLNILPGIALASAVLLDQNVIWMAERVRRASPNKLLLTRPIITRRTIYYCVAIICIDLLIFFAPFPWLSQGYTNNAFTFDSFNTQASMLDPNFGGGSGLLLNRLFSFSCLNGIKHTDELHTNLLASLRSYSPDGSDLVLLDTWWHRWGYYYLPKSTIYDIRDFPESDSLWIGRSKNFIREGLSETEVHLESGKRILLLLRSDCPSFKAITAQVHLERVPLPEYLDIYRITDDHFSLQWKNVRFIMN